MDKLADIICFVPALLIWIMIISLGTVVSFLKDPINFILWLFLLPYKPKINGQICDITGELVEGKDVKKSTIRNYLKKNKIKYNLIIECPFTGWEVGYFTVYKIY